MKKINIKAAIASAAVIGALVLPTAAPAQVVVTDPGATGILSAVQGVQTSMAAVQNTQLVKEALSAYNLTQQVQQMIKDHVDVSSIVKGAGNSLLANVSKNAGMMDGEIGIDQNVLQHFQKLVPSFDGNQNYLQYLQKQKASQYLVYTSALGISNNEIQTQSQVQQALQTIANAPAANQLQALNELVSIGKLQVNQMSSLLKIQGAMMKSMAVAYAAGAQNGFGNSSLANAPPSSAQAHAVCATQKVWMGNLDSADQAKELAECRTELPANPTPQ